MKVLLTGFEPFGTLHDNPTRGVLAGAEALRVSGLEAVAEVLPVVFDEAGRRMRALIAEHSPDLVLAFGVAADRVLVTPERVAINVADAPIADNAGAQPADQPVDIDGPAAYFSTLPIKAIVAALEDAGVPAAVSDTAGTYVCNAVFYATQRALAGSQARGGFIHVPLDADVASLVPIVVEACLAA